MSAKKAESPRPKTLFFHRIMRIVRFVVGPGRKAAMLLLVLAGLGALWYALWDHVYEHVLASSDYRLDPHDIQVTPQPSWIKADVRAEVIRDASLETSLSIMDDDLNVRVAQAFRLHPWIAKVNRVSRRHPAGVEVELDYRGPVAMVEVSGGLLPVDIDGVLLPSEDFSPLEARNYPRITDIGTTPVGPPGKRWGDARVTGAAQVAAVLLSHWQDLKLYRISPVSFSGRGNDDSYVLYTHAGTQIYWGRPPGSMAPGQPPANEKLRRLVDYVAANGSLEGSKGPQQIDLRGTDQMIVAPRVAITPLPLEDDTE